MEVPAGRVGALIGKSGATLRRLEQETGAPWTGPVSSNRLRWDESGTLIAVEPNPPCTSLDKDRTHARNLRFFEEECGARRSLLVLGDSVTDLDVSHQRAPAALALRGRV